MEKQLLALNPVIQDVSSADCKRHLEKKPYDWKIKKAENLKIIYSILAHKNYGVELIPNCDETAFLEAVEENLKSQEIQHLADIIYKMHEELNERIENYKLAPEQKTFFFGWSGDIESYQDYINELTDIYLAEMKEERDILAALSDRLDRITTIEPSEQKMAEFWEA